MKWQEDYNLFYNRWQKTSSAEAHIRFDTLAKWLGDDSHPPSLFLYYPPQRGESKINKKFFDKLNKYMEQVRQVFVYPRRHLRQEQIIRTTEKVTRINPHTLKYLAARSEHWATSFPEVYPLRLKTEIWEDDWALYENSASVTLVKDLDFEINKYTAEAMYMYLQDYTFGNQPGCIESSNRKVYADAGSDFNIQNLFPVLRNIKNNIHVCKRSKLFKKLFREPPILGTLKPTNIFLQDSAYNKVYKLWGEKKKFKIKTPTLTSKDEQKKSDSVKRSFRLHNKLILLFALKTLGFESDKDLLNKFTENLCEVTYANRIWRMSLSDEGEQIKCQLSLKGTLTVPLAMDVNFVSEEEKKFSVQKRGNTLIFSRKLNKNMIQEFCNLLSEKWNINRWNKNDITRYIAPIRQQLNDFPAEKSFTLFIDVSFDPLPKKEEFTVWLQKQYAKRADGVLVKIIPDSILSFSDEYKEYTENFSLLMYYPYPNTELDFGIIPININDRHAYRRYIKLLLPFLIELDEGKHCPYCCEKLTEQGTCWACHFGVTTTICGSGDSYYYTSGTEDQHGKTLDKVITDAEDRREIEEKYKNQVKWLLAELNSKFLNVTPLLEENSCPHCLARRLQNKYVFVDKQN